MSIEPPKSHHEALQQAMLEIGNLRKRMPGINAGEVLDVLDQTENIWSKQDLDQFPFNILIREINTIKAEVREAYADELNLTVERRSSVFDQVVDLDHRVRIYSELVIVDPIYRGLEKRLQRIEGVLPSRNYAFRDVLGDVHPSFHPDLRKRLEVALGHFEREEYESSITECGKAEGILFPLFKGFLANFGISGVPSQIGAAISKIREILKAKQDTDGLSLSKSSRLEILVLSMFETLHYFRNLGAHDRAEETAEEKLPEWQVNRRLSFTQRPECARLVLILTLQIALELRALLDHQGKST
jgi:hypothetical protein